MLFHYCFNLHLPYDICCKGSFHMLICYPNVFDKVLDEILDQILISVFYYYLFSRALCIFLDKTPLSDSFENIFFHFSLCIIILLVFYFIKQNFFILMNSSFSVISFKSFVLYQKKTWAYLKSCRFSPVLFSRGFIILLLKLRSMINFK